jgi:hypothetical protein
VGWIKSTFLQQISALLFARGLGALGDAPEEGGHRGGDEAQAGAGRPYEKENKSLTIYLRYLML